MAVTKPAPAETPVPYKRDHWRCTEHTPLIKDVAEIKATSAATLEMVRDLKDAVGRLNDRLDTAQRESVARQLAASTQGAQTKGVLTGVLKTAMLIVATGGGIGALVAAFTAIARWIDN